jgi:hypothetical protein
MTVRSAAAWSDFLIVQAASFAQSRARRRLRTCPASDAHPAANGAGRRQGERDALKSGGPAHTVRGVNGIGPDTDSGHGSRPYSEPVMTDRFQVTG